MKVTTFLNAFDLSEGEQALKILCCSTEPLSSDEASPESSIQCVNPSLLPKLPFNDASFDLALIFNTLFVDEEKQTEDFLLKSLVELSRIASEVRVFPIVNNAGKPFHYLGSVLQSLQEKGYGVELRTIKHGQASGTAELRIWNESCVLEREQVS